MKEEVEKDREDLAIQLGVAQTVMQSFNHAGKTKVFL